MTTIVLAHPYNLSFNYAILEKIVATLKEDNQEYKIIDLYQDNFNPVLSLEELANYNSGYTNDSLVIKYQKIIKQTSQIIFIFPIWWNDTPAILRGFFDRVMLKDFAWVEGLEEIEPILNIEKCLLITTSGTSTKSYINDKNNPIEDTLIKITLPSFGMFNGIWLNCDTLNEDQIEERTTFLNNLSKYL